MLLVYMLFLQLKLKEKVSTVVQSIDTLASAPGIISSRMPEMSTPYKSEIPVNQVMSTYQLEILYNLL